MTTTDLLPRNSTTVETEPSFVFDADLALCQTYYPLGFPVEIRTNDSRTFDVAARSWGGRNRRASADENRCVTVRVRVSSVVDLDPVPAPSFRAEAHLVRITANPNNYAVCDLKNSFAFIDISMAVLDDQEYLRYHFLESVVLLLIATGFSMAIHAACVSRNGTGILLCGESGAGKSTLAYACARRGFDYTTDDACYLLLDEEIPTVVGHAHKFRFRPHARELFPELAARSITPKAEGKPSVEVLSSEISGIRSLGQVRIDVIVLLRRSTVGAAYLRPMATEDALASLDDHLYPGEEIRRMQQLSLRRLLPLRAFEFHYSQLDEAVKCLRSLTEAG